MRTAIIVSASDPAGMNIKNNLLQMYNFSETGCIFEADSIYSLGEIFIYTAKAESIHCENIDQKIQAGQIIFATKHQSVQGTPSLCVHTPGNWDKAEMGGAARMLCPANPYLMRRYFIELTEAAKDSGFELTMECTHHGPITSVPTMFCEIGSCVQQWTDKIAGRIVAQTIMQALHKSETGSMQGVEVAVGLGGPHYCNDFNKAVLRSSIAIGHVCPKHFLHVLDEGMLRQAIEKSGAKLVLLDWKGLGGEKAKVKELTERIGIESRRV